MKKIGWLKIKFKKYGGAVYEESAIEALSGTFECERIIVDSKVFKRGYLRIPELLFNLLKIKGEKDLWILDNTTVMALPFLRIRGRTLAVVHHIDFSSSSFRRKPLNFLMEKMTYSGLKKADFIVTVSGYWENYFLGKGYKNVFKIYNGFDLSQFNISEKEVGEFKERHNLTEKPIIYIGNCQKAKGVVGSYQALKDLNVYLVTSGDPSVKIPAINLKLEYREYLKLLRASSVVLTMSEFKEGWCRTAHEAMLLKIPVIGSGRGGMEELLRGGKQIICKDFNQLKPLVTDLLNNPARMEEMGGCGYEFAAEFTVEKFKNNWINLLNKII